MLKELRTQHRTIIQMVFSGYKNKEIAERLEMSDCNVSQIVRSPLGQAYLEGLQDTAREATLDVRKKLVSMNKSALGVLERIMNPAEKAPHSVQFGAAKDVLDRTGYKAPDKLHVDMTMQTKTDQEIDAEINAVQQSISKTYLQSPEKLATVPEIHEEPIAEPLAETHNFAETVEASSNEAFTDEPMLQEEKLDSPQAMDSSGNIILSPNCSKQPESVAVCPPKQLKNSLNDLPEESILLGKIPTDIFQQLKN